MDIVEPSVRSRMMASVKQKDTTPEMALRRALHRLGLRYRLHKKGLPGTPDLVFGPLRAVVFVHGCFWHAHDCKFASVPRTRPEYWAAKLQSNRERDARVEAALVEGGWRVKTVWGCSLRSARDVGAAAKDVQHWLHEVGQSDSRESSD